MEICVHFFFALQLENINKQICDSHLDALRKTSDESVQDPIVEMVSIDKLIEMHKYQRILQDMKQAIDSKARLSVANV